MSDSRDTIEQRVAQPAGDQPTGDKVVQTETTPVDAAAVATSLPGTIAVQTLSNPSAETPAPPQAALSVRRIPHFGHTLLLLLLLFAGLLCSGVLALVALRFHLFGVSNLEQAQKSMIYNLGIMGLVYLIAFLPAAAVFPLLWRRGVLAGLQWCGDSARRLAWRLIGIGVACAGVALVLQSVLHLPRKSPIQEMLNSPQAAWLMFAFGVTVAPFCEEVLFRGFLLPSFCTAFDWTREKITRSAPPALLPNQHPQWSFPAMIFGATVTSVFFAGMHASQTAHAKGVILMLWSMGMVLSAIRLKTRSLAASTLTHAAYNFTLFLMVLIGTHGFHNFQQ